MTPKTALDAPAGKLDDMEQQYVAKIREHGWTATNVFADDEGPGFSYSTGFFHSLGVPDIIMFSVPAEAANGLFWDLYRRQADGERFETGQFYDDILGNKVKACLLPVVAARFEDHLTWTRWFHLGQPTPAVQLVWPDKTGLFPFSEGAHPDFSRVQHDMTEGGWAGMSG